MLVFWTFHHSSVYYLRFYYYQPSKSIVNIFLFVFGLGLLTGIMINPKRKMRNYNSKREDLEEEDQGEDERNVIL